MLRGKCLLPERRHLQFHRPGLGVGRPFITASPRVLAAVGSCVFARAAQPVGFRIQHRIL